MVLDSQHEPEQEEVPSSEDGAECSIRLFQAPGEHPDRGIRRAMRESVARANRLPEDGLRWT